MSLMLVTANRRKVLDASLRLWHIEVATHPLYAHVALSRMDNTWWSSLYMRMVSVATLSFPNVTENTATPSRVPSCTMNCGSNSSVSWSPLCRWCLLYFKISIIVGRLWHQYHALALVPYVRGVALERCFAVLAEVGRRCTLCTGFLLQPFVDVLVHLLQPFGVAHIVLQRLAELAFRSRRGV